MSDKSTIPISWLRLTLGDVIDYGKTVKAEPREIPANAWVLELEDIEKDTSKLLKYVIFTQRLSKSTKNRFWAGDVLYGKLRPYLNKVIIADQDGYCTTEIVPLRPNIAINGQYLFYWLKHAEFLNYVESVSHGIQMPRLGTEAGLKAPLVLAPFKEQCRIAAELDSLFARSRRAREELERIPKLIERYKQAVLAAAFRGDLTADWRESNSKGEPWKRASLGSVIQNIRYGTSKKCDYLPALTPVLRIPNIGDGYIVHNDIKYAEFDAKEREGLQLQLGDILIIRSNGSLDLVGKAAIVSEKEEGFLYAGYLIRLRPDCEIILPEYLYYHLINPETRAEIESRAKSTSGVNNINSQELQSLNLHIPGIQEQKAIIQRIEKLFRKIDLMKQEHQKASGLCDRLDQATLSKAFRGELVPQHPDDEPASVLLERILAEQQGQASAKRGRSKKAG